MDVLFLPSKSCPVADSPPAASLAMFSDRVPANVVCALVSPYGTGPGGSKLITELS